MRSAQSHKGENGTVLIIGGSKRYTGAPYFAGLAALRLGADLATIMTIESVAHEIKALCPDLITIGLPGTHLSVEHAASISEEMARADVCVIGPGMTPESDELLRLLAKETPAKVIDAEALRAIDLGVVRNAVLTPHHGELAALLANAHIADDDLQARLHDNILLIKGHEDRVLSKDRSVTVSGGNPGITVGGTGDVLAGLVAGFISQGLDHFSAAKQAAKLNKRIGDALQEALGNGFIASDFLKLIAEAYEQMRKEL